MRTTADLPHCTGLLDELRSQSDLLPRVAAGTHAFLDYASRPTLRRGRRARYSRRRVDGDGARLVCSSLSTRSTLESRADHLAPNRLEKGLGVASFYHPLAQRRLTEILSMRRIARVGSTSLDCFIASTRELTFFRSVTQVSLREQQSSDRSCRSRKRLSVPCAAQYRLGAEGGVIVCDVRDSWRSWLPHLGFSI